MAKRVRSKSAHKRRKKSTTRTRREVSSASKAAPLPVQPIAFAGHSEHSATANSVYTSFAAGHIIPPDIPAVVARTSAGGMLPAFSGKCPPFSPQPIPAPTATSGPFIAVPGHENFAGGGYADTAKTRPAGLFGFISKFHDFGYTCNDLEFFRGPRCMLELSRFAKMDAIFIALNKQVYAQLGSLSQFSDWLAGLTFRGHRRFFLKDDGFVNPMIDPALNRPDEYLMFPYNILPSPRPTKRVQRIDTVISGGRNPQHIVTQYEAPDYNAAVEFDHTNDWRAWAQSVYTPVLWDAACSLSSADGDSFDAFG